MSCHSSETDIRNETPVSSPTPDPSTGSPASGTTDVIENSSSSPEHTFRNLKIMFKTYKYGLRAATEKHRHRYNARISSIATNATRKALTSMHVLLVSNIDQLRLDCTPLEVVAVGARLAAIKECCIYLEARLNDFERFTSDVEVMLIRLKWREVRHKMLSKIYSE